MKRFPLLQIFSFVTVTVCLAACANTPPSRFYTLNSLVAQKTENPSDKAAHTLSISISPVEIPDYLERPQIVTLTGRNELKLAEFDRWAGSFAENISTVLAENLGQLLGTDKVFVALRIQSFKPDYSLVVKVLRLDCVPGDQVVLKAQWALISGADKNEVATHISTCSEKLKDKQYDTLVAAISRTLEQLSREIAREIPAR